MMGRSLVLPSSTMNMAEWEQDGAPLNSSNEDEDEYEQRVRSPHAARWHDPPAFYSPPHFQQRTASNQTPFPHLQRSDPDQYAACHAATLAASTTDTLPYPFVAAPTQLRQEDYMPFLAFGAAQKHIKQEEEGDDSGGDDDRKPAARKEGESETKKSTSHYNRHSLSNDPYQESQESVQETPIVDQYINPCLSFGDDDDVRHDEEHFGLPGWSAANDPALQHHRGYAGTTPSYAPPLAFTIGDRFPMPPQSAQESPPQLVGSAAARATRHNSAQREIVRPRAPSVAELEAERTERGKAAVVTWYERFNELVEYREVHGDCNVPQKYPPNPRLGIVSVKSATSLSVFRSFPSPRYHFLFAVGQQATDGKEVHGGRQTNQYACKQNRSPRVDWLCLGQAQGRSVVDDQVQ
jgi:Helicase associated domain